MPHEIEYTLFLKFWKSLKIFEVHIGMPFGEYYVE